MPTDSDRPIVFGTAKIQRMLLDMYENGDAPCGKEPSQLLFRSGLAYRFERRGAMNRISSHAALDSRHPASALVLAVLQNLSGKQVIERANEPPDEPRHEIDSKHPLCHRSDYDFRVLQRVAEAGETGANLQSLRLRIHDAWPTSIAASVARLADDGLLETDEGDFHRISPMVPPAFVELVRGIAKSLAAKDTRFGTDVKAVQRVTGNARASDDAPRVFGTDLRLRTLMALAKYGAMDVRDVRRAIGGSSVRMSSKRQCDGVEGNLAPFGRGGVVRIWNSGTGLAARLDPDYPCAPELVRFLLKMEESYPLVTDLRILPEPPLPERRRWVGDYNVLFGGFVASRILASIGHLGWTYAKLATRAANAADQSVVGVVLRMEEDGIIEGDRARRGRGDVRILTVSKTFPASEELIALLRRYVEAFPTLKGLIENALYENDKTVAQLRNRGLLP